MSTSSVTGVDARRIVVADNDPDALELLVTDLRLEGHEIVGAATGGEQARAMVEALHPDVLVIDHRMPPGPWGMDVAEEIRRTHPDVSVVVYSNYQSSELLRRSRDVGIRFVPKGNLRTLRRAVDGR